MRIWAHGNATNSLGYDNNAARQVRGCLVRRSQVNFGARWQQLVFPTWPAGVRAQAGGINKLFPARLIF
jgi:hypothetical protein